MTSRTVTIEDGPTVETLLAHVTDPVVIKHLLDAQVVLLPRHVGESADGKAVFASETLTLHQFLTDNLRERLRAEIAAADDQYQESVLHAADLWLPPLLLLFDSPAQASVILNVVSSYIYDALRGGLSSPRDTTVHAKISVNRKKGTLSFSYDGPADAYASVMNNAIKAALSTIDEEAGGGRGAA